ncbi:MAG: hypothetical protein COV91_01755 [Candidatus Taylorbacteria bacterium CG11_big_fil_rev_8_21_14_0_20_46_11]|uniref:Pseudouridine synthase n=1 Tax=Candidatus Taylorbacteria bacterium CG11_big_fil_rev_8_21_14_0_20_46_11 TaxID=1975025 RepID=A0A2H0KCC7_9BACT|nr:MAG: hypothetical protein COV91_01755 [Candidatus Taylorbacteria bacterium CG11_big_fil_rev_8_21_14_0_20_46_11]
MATRTTKQKIPILYEDDDVLVINKPAGLIVHSDGRILEPTVVDWILEKYPDIRGVGDQIKDLRFKAEEMPSLTDNLNPTSDNLERSGIVHRLDRETSGALVIAKNQIAFARLKKQFQRQLVHKRYQTFVYGSMKKDDGLIDMPIARSARNPVLWSATRGKKGEKRDALTEYQVLKRNKDFTFLDVYPRTGRTHQIRVHLKAINYPIVSDRLYSQKYAPALGFSRLALHSRSVSFIQPTTEQRIIVEAPYPEDFVHAISLINPESKIHE